MQVKLDDIDLVTRVQPEATSPLSEVRSVWDVRVDGTRDIVELKILGSQGNVVQDMGRKPVTIFLSGDIWGPDSKKTVEAIKAKVDSGDSLSFTSDLLAAASVSDVMVESFNVFQVAAAPTRYRYRMVLKEAKKGGTAGEGVASEIGAPEEAAAETPPDQTEEAEEEAAKESELHDIRVHVIDAAGNPLTSAEVVITGPDGEREDETDSDGYVLLLDVPEGEYEITSPDERFKGIKQTLEVKKEGGEGGEEGQ